MKKPLDWQDTTAAWARQLEQNTGAGLDAWNERIQREQLPDEQSLRAWLTQQGVIGYGQMLLVMERFGYPDYLVASADQLIDAQYADRPQLRPIFETLVNAASALGEVTIQSRKTYVSLLTPRRTFARIQPATRSRLDLALRLDDQKPGGRLQPSKIHETMKVQIGFTTMDEVDAEALGWLKLAYEQNV